VAIDQTPQGLSPACKSELLSLDDSADGDDAGTLPQTSTPAGMLLMMGVAMVGVALIAMRAMR
jgi:hypothetical protein